MSPCARRAATVRRPVRNQEQKYNTENTEHHSRNNTGMVAEDDVLREERVEASAVGKSPKDAHRGCENSTGDSPCRPVRQAAAPAEKRRCLCILRMHMEYASARRTRYWRTAARFLLVCQPGFLGLDEPLREIGFCCEDHLPTMRVERNERPRPRIVETELVAEALRLVGKSVPSDRRNQAPDSTEEAPQSCPPRRGGILGYRKEKRLLLVALGPQVLKFLV